MKFSTDLYMYYSGPGMGDMRHKISLIFYYYKDVGDMGHEISLIFY